jgi:protein-S-isoprenylcysteine O-methyltransferase Ste14
VSVILITIYLVKKDPKLLERRVKAVPTAETEKTQKKIVSLLNIFFIFIFIVAGLDFRYRWSYLPLYISLFADVFVALGFYIVFRVFKENSFTSGIIEVAEDQKVISTGPYRIVRHPMYAGALLMLFFTPLVLDSYWAIICVIPLSVSIAARAIDEEKFLIKNLSGYEEYCQKVQYRLIPLIW